jgi:hypothetical protein
MSKSAVILITIVAWALGCAYTAYAYATSHTAPFYADEYVFEFVSRLLRFGLCRFPLWLAGLLAVISAEMVWLKPLHRKLK